MSEAAPGPTPEQIVTLARFKIAGHFDHLACMSGPRIPIDPIVAKLAHGQCRSVAFGETSLMLERGWIKHVPPGGRYRLTDLGDALLASAAEDRRGRSGHGSERPDA